VIPVCRAPMIEMVARMVPVTGSTCVTAFPDPTQTPPSPTARPLEK
jgi:hypothetical protein